MSLAHLYIVIGSVSFVASVLTTVVLITKLVNQPEAHGFFSYSDTVARSVWPLDTGCNRMVWDSFCKAENALVLVYLERASRQKYRVDQDELPFRVEKDITNHLRPCCTCISQGGSSWSYEKMPYRLVCHARFVQLLVLNKTLGQILSMLWSPRPQFVMENMCTALRSTRYNSFKSGKPQEGDFIKWYTDGSSFQNNTGWIYCMRVGELETRGSRYKR